jgi:NitT/TauT family transport system substrate-binding protein
MFMKKVFCMMMVVGVVLVGAIQVVAETYTLGCITNVAFAEYNVAEVKGFWEQQGVTVKVMSYDMAAEAARGAMQRHFDLDVLPMPVLATLRNEGVFDATYLGTFSAPIYSKAVILKKDLLNKSLKGQTIGIFASDHANRFFLSSYLKKVNTDLKDVRLVPMNPNDLEANFIKNRLQAVLNIVGQNYTPYEQADGVVVASARDVYEPHGLAFIKQGGIAAIQPEDLKKILRGVVEAIEWMRDPANWDEYKVILKQHIFAKRPDLSDDQIRKLTEQELFFDPQTLLEHNQQKLSDYFTQFRAFLVAEGSLKADVLNGFTYDNVIKNQMLIEVLQELGK